MCEQAEVPSDRRPKGMFCADDLFIPSLTVNIGMFFCSRFAGEPPGNGNLGVAFGDWETTLDAGAEVVGLRKFRSD